MVCDAINIPGTGIFIIIRELAAIVITYTLFGLPALLFIIKKKTEPIISIILVFVSIFVSKISYILWLNFISKNVFIWIIFHLFFSILLYLIQSRYISTAVCENTDRLKKADLIALLTIISITALFTVIPQSRIAAPKENTYIVRAYFVPDYLKHVALSAEISKGDMPPDNPFVTGNKLHYYWIYYLFPAFGYNLLSRHGSLLRLNIFSNLLANIFLIFSIYAFSKKYMKSITKKSVLIFAFIFASSYEGILYLLESLKSKADILSNFINYNIDGLTRWRYGQPQIDTIYRSFLYTPQQQIGFAGLLIFIFLLTEKGRKTASNSNIIIIPVITGIVLGYNFFCGLYMALWFFVIYPIFLCIKERNILEIIKRQALSFIVFIIFPVFYKILDMLLESRNPLLIGFNIYRPFNMIMIFLINFSWLWIPVVFFCCFPIIKSIKKKRADIDIDMIKFISMILLAVSLIFFIQIRGFEADMGLKIGQVLNIILFAGFLYLCSMLKRRILFLCFILLFIPGLMTSIIDFANSCDIKNAPGMFLTFFRAEDICAMRHIKENINKDAVIQALPERDDKRASIIPVFGERRTALADEMHSKIYMLDEMDIYEKRKEKIYEMFYADEMEDVYHIAEEYGIDYLFVGTKERDIPEIVENLDRFPKAYEGYGTTLYDVKRVNSKK